jgi:hypothetical protein
VTLFTNAHLWTTGWLCKFSLVEWGRIDKCRQSRSITNLEAGTSRSDVVVRRPSSLERCSWYPIDSVGLSFVLYSAQEWVPSNVHRGHFISDSPGFHFHSLRMLRILVTMGVILSWMFALLLIFKHVSRLWSWHSQPFCLSPFIRVLMPVLPLFSPLLASKKWL